MTAPFEPSLFHARQVVPWGCMWHAYYALAGVPDLLAHAREADPHRIAALLAARGLLVSVLFIDLLKGLHAQTPPEFWHRILENTRELGASLRLAVRYVMPTGISHAVAVEVHSNEVVTISDSLHPRIVHVAFEEFLASPLARAFHVEQLVSAAVDDHPSQDILAVFAARHGSGGTT